MKSKKTISIIAIILFIGFIALRIFGKYIALPIWSTFYTIDVIPLDFKTHLLFAIEPVISLIIPICYAIFLFKYSKLFDKNVILWATLGLIKGPLVIILFLLTLFTQKSNDTMVTLKLKYKRIIIWTLLLILFGIVFGTLRKAAFTPLYTYFFSPEVYQQHIMLTRIDVFILVIYKLLINVGIAIWINNETRKMNLFPSLWTTFALISGFTAPILLFIYKIIDSKIEKNTAANTV